LPARGERREESFMMIYESLCIKCKFVNTLRNRESEIARAEKEKWSYKTDLPNTPHRD